MDIKEVEQMLSVSRSNVRFYEKQGLLKPARKENNYRDYSHKDIATLKKIIILRKMGLTVEEISLIKKGELSLADVAVQNKSRLEAEIEELKGALNLTEQLSKDTSNFDEMDEEFYWDSIHNAEKAGEKFIDICKDYMMFELDMFDNMWKYVFFHNFKASRKKYGILFASCILLILCIFRGVSRMLIWQESFWNGFLYPIVLFIICTVIMLPLYILAKKAPKIAGIVNMLLLILIVLFFVLLACLILYGIIGKIIS